MASEEQPAAQNAGVFNPCCLGYGIQWGLRLTLLFADTLFIGRTDRGMDAFCNALMLGVLGVYVVAFAAFRNTGGSEADQRRHVRVVERSCLAQAALTVLGAALIAIAPLGPHFQPVSIAAGACLGCSMGTGVYGWIYLYMRRGPAAARTALVSSWLLGVGMFALLTLLPSLPRILAIATLGVASTAMELRYTQDVAGYGMDEEGTVDCTGKPIHRIQAPDAEARRRETWKLAPITVATAVLGFAYGMSGPLQLSGGGVSTGDVNLLVNHLTTLLVASLAASLVLFARTDRRLDLLPVFLAAFTLDTTAAIALPFAGSGYLTLCATVFGVVNRITGMLVLYSCATLPDERTFFRASPFLLGASGLGLTTGIVVGNGLFSGIADDYMVLTVITLVIMYVIFLALTVVLIARGRQGQDAQVPAAQTCSDSARVATSEIEGTVDDSITNPPAIQTPASASSEWDAFERIGTLYGLSEREREVMELLAKGRGVPFTAEQLGLSQNTVKAYAKSLYKKLDVHSREELMDLVEQF